MSEFSAMACFSLRFMLMHQIKASAMPHIRFIIYGINYANNPMAGQIEKIINHTIADIVLNKKRPIHFYIPYRLIIARQIMPSEF